MRTMTEKRFNDYKAKIESKPKHSVIKTVSKITI